MESDLEKTIDDLASKRYKELTSYDDSKIYRSEKDIAFDAIKIVQAEQNILKELWIHIRKKMWILDKVSEKLTERINSEIEKESI